MSWHTPSTFTEPSEVEQVITANAPTHGVYMLPLNEDSDDQAAAITKGPFIYAIIRPDALEKPWSMNKSLIIAFVINLLCSLVIATCVLRIRATRFISRASVGITLGSFAALSMALPCWLWFEMPTSHTIAATLDPIIAYTLAGIVIASIIKPPRARRIFS